MDNKVIKVFAIILAIILIIVIINFIFIIIFGKGKNYQIKLLAFGNKTNLVAKNEYSINEVGKIQIDTKSNNVKIVQGSEDKIKVIIHGFEGEKYNIDNSNNELKIKEDSRVFYLISFFCFVKQEIIVEVPNTYDKDIRYKYNQWKYKNRQFAK